jgi:hypothetical protein
VIGTRRAERKNFASRARFRTRNERCTPTRVANLDGTTWGEVDFTIATRAQAR